MSLIFLKGNNFSLDSVKGLLIPIAALCYAVNLNLLKYKLGHLSPLVISANSLLFAIPLSLGGLYFSGFSVRLDAPEGMHVLWLLILLGVTSTGVALVLFNKLLQISTPMFASSVTYAIPVVALSWGFLDGEVFSQWLALGMVTIIISLWLISKKKSA
jgi:drug/metabolite transporter (DMT)-like permease